MALWGLLGLAFIAGCAVNRDAELDAERFACGLGGGCDGGIGFAADVPDVPDVPAAPAGMELIPAKSFMMGRVPGDTQFESDETPQHTVYVDAFYIDVYEVTVAKYQACVDAGKCKTEPKDATYSSYCNWKAAGKEQHPVNCVTWFQAKAYCESASVYDGKGRLPTEAEWEKAARGGLDGKLYPWGDTLDCAHAVYDDGMATTGQGCDSASTMAVGSKPAGKNGYGLYDMAGNVWEWVADEYDASWYGKPGAINKNSCNNCTSEEMSGARSLRGGSWYDNNPDSLRASSRGGNGPTNTNNNVGIRCARMPF